MMSDSKLLKSVQVLEHETNKLKDLKEKGKFNLMQSEYALQRLTNKLINIWMDKDESS